jgi:hypothetical protein
VDIKKIGRCYIHRKIFHWLLDLDVRDPVGMCLIDIVSGPPCFNGMFAHYDKKSKDSWAVCFQGKGCGEGGLFNNIKVPLRFWCSPC